MQAQFDKGNGCILILAVFLEDDLTPLDKTGNRGTDHIVLHHAVFDQGIAGQGESFKVFDQGPLGRHHGGAFCVYFALGRCAVVGIADSFTVEDERLLAERGFIVAGAVRSASNGKLLFVEPFLGIGESDIHLDGVGLSCGCKDEYEGKDCKQGFHR